jgi:hypothetical protein
MSLRRTLAVLTGAALASVVTLGAASPASAHQSHEGHHSKGTRSLASVLARDGAGFDRNRWDFDIVDNAVRAVLGAKPGSPVKVLADGKVALTAFLPNDNAFRLLATDLTGKRYTSEKAVFADVASLGIDTVEAVLLYHVVPGATVDYRTALRSDNAALTTASGGTVTVDVYRGHLVRLIDADPNDYNPWVVRPNINKGNKQIAHGISHVLRPADL